MSLSYSGQCLPNGLRPAVASTLLFLFIYSTNVLIYSKSLGSHPQIDMKELQAGIQLVQAKYIQLNQHRVSKKKARTLGRIDPLSKPVAVKVLPQQVSDRQKPLLSFPVKSSLEVLRKRTTEGVERLESQAQRINQLSAELEAAVLELKAIASEVNRDWRALQAIQEPGKGAICAAVQRFAIAFAKPGATAAKREARESFIPDVCEYQAANVPNVKQKPSGSFVLTSRPVDLFQAEREAALLAQTLRQRARRKRI